MRQEHYLDAFQHYFKKDIKAWFSPLRIIYSHSLLHNIIYNRTGVNAHLLSHRKYLSNLRFAFNRMRLFYFTEKPTTTLRHGSKTMKKPCFSEKTYLLKHLSKRKKMEKTYTR